VAKERKEKVIVFIEFPWRRRGARGAKGESKGGQEEHEGLRP